MPAERIDRMPERAQKGAEVMSSFLREGWGGRDKFSKSKEEGLTI